jgi:predicted secreted protein
MNKLVLTGISLFALTTTAFASEQAPIQDHVVLTLSEEGWVTTHSADVDVFFNIVQQKETADELKAEILVSLEKLAPGAEWYILSSRESKDRTGLNRWNVSANARLSETNIAGLQDKAEKYSRAGFKMSIGQTNFAPSLDERNALLASLRNRIYVKAKEEAERLSKAMGGNAYRVQSVNFVSNYVPHQPVMAKNMAMQRVSSTMEADNSGGGGGSKMPVSEKHNIQATITLGRLVALEK